MLTREDRLCTNSASSGTSGACLTVYLCVRQLDSADEQAAAIRRELDGRMQKVAEMERVRPRLRGGSERRTVVEE